MRPSQNAGADGRFPLPVHFGKRLQPRKSPYLPRLGNSVPCPQAGQTSTVPTAASASSGLTLGQWSRSYDEQADDPSRQLGGLVGHESWQALLPEFAVV